MNGRRTAITRSALLEVRNRPARLAGVCCFTAALGLGFLTKGPVILLLAGVTLAPYLASGRRLAWGLRRLWCGWGVLIFAALAIELAGRRAA